MTTTVYGIANCDTMKKARTWLEEHEVAYVFHDYKKASIDATTVRGWCAILGWEKLLNRSGTTFRKLPEANRIDLTEAKAIDLMVGHPSMIKRPVLQSGSTLLAGFAPDTYLQAGIGK
jgi:arsenate reductase